MSTPATTRPTTSLRRTALATTLLVGAMLGNGDHQLAAPAGSTGGPAGPEGAEQWFVSQRAAPDGAVHFEARAQALAAAHAMQARVTRGMAAGAVPSVWASLGPTNIGGRITDLVGDPANENLLYVATASGGVWKTIDGGGSWSAIFDGQGSLAIGAIAGEPANPNILYVGTGEANPGGGSLAYGGDGVWKSLDGGASWRHLGLAATSSIGRIAVDPLRHSHVFAAAMGDLFSPNPDRGLYRSLDGGAWWSRVLFVNDSTGCVDVAIDPAHPDRVYAATWERTRRASTRTYGGAGSGVWRSLDGGTTWTRLAGGLPPASANSGRIGIALAPSAPLTLYAIYSDAAGTFTGFYRSLDGGDTWTQTESGPLAIDSPYCWWFGRIWVNPQDSAQAWVDGLRLHRTDDGGDSWTTVFGLHPDQHAQWIKPSDPMRMWEGNDGGLYHTFDGGETWTIVTGLPTVQLYSVEASAADPHRIYGGAQDNGMLRTPTPTDGWGLLFSGDGQYVVVDPTTTNTVYAAWQYGNLLRSTNGGSTFAAATSGIATEDRKNWSTPVVVDPVTKGRAQTRLYYGANRLYRSNNSAATWTAVSSDLSNGDAGANGVVYGTITSMAVAPSDSATIYVATDDGNVWVSSDFAATWQAIRAGLPQRWITRVVVDPVNPAIAYVTLSGYRWNESLAHVFRTADRGGTWTDITGNLPGAPVNDLAVDTRDRAVLYVATDVGVFATATTGATWASLGIGLPAGVVVTDLKFMAGANPTLYAATYGRGAYVIDLTNGVLDTGPPAVHAALDLASARPNPWRESTVLEFMLPAALRARLDVIDMAGRRVATLAEGELGAGRHQVVWNGRDSRGAAVPPGVYFARLRAGGHEAVRKTLRMR